MTQESVEQRRSPGGRLDRLHGPLALALVAALAFVLAAWLAVPWAWVPGGHLTPARASTVFTTDQLTRIDAYSWSARLSSWAALAVSVAVVTVLGFTRLGAALVGRLPGGWVIRAVLAAGLVLVAGRLAALPFRWHLHRLALEYGLSRQSAGGWVVDLAKGFLVSWVAMAVLVLVIVGLARRRPHSWHLWGAGVCAGLVVAGSFLYPIVVEPLFNTFTPMTDGPLKSSILELARRDHVPLEDVLVADASRRTTTLNAYVSGIGASRRVVVYDNTLADLSDAQVLSVVAHELTHARYDDVLTGTVLGAVGAISGVGLLAWLLDRRRVLSRSGATSAGDPGVVPLILALVAVAGLLSSPVQNTISRAVEARADRGALTVPIPGLGPQQQRRAFVTMQRRLALQSLSDPSPPWLSQIWFGSHPTVLQRIGLADSLRKVGSR